jgi:hypothetical protein
MKYLLYTLLITLMILFSIEPYTLKSTFIHCFIILINILAIYIVDKKTNILFIKP